MSQPSPSVPQRSGFWRRVRILSAAWSDIAWIMFAVIIAYELGHAQGYKRGVADMWRAEMRIIHSLTDDDDEAAVGGL